MIIQQRTVIILLQFFLVLLVFFGPDRTLRLHPATVDATNIHCSQNSDENLTQCEDFDEDAGEVDHASNPEYSLQANASWPLFAATAGRRYPNISKLSLPVVYLPVFAPPKLIA
ncbi:MAG: hypothetical protein WC007_17670 [Pelobacteraceae bacterium]